MAQQANPELPQQTSYEADDVVKEAFNPQSQSANIKQVYKVKATELTSQILLGTQWQAHDTKTMKELGISHLISCMKDDWGFVHNLKSLDETRIEIEEMDKMENGMKSGNDGNAETVPIQDILDNVLSPFLEIVLKEKSNRILVYCSSSTNHSPTIGVALMMHSEGMDLKTAHQFVKDKHGKMMCISAEWMKQLQALDYKLFGKHSAKGIEIETKETKMAAILAKMQKAKLELAQNQNVEASIASSAAPTEQKEDQ